MSETKQFKVAQLGFHFPPERGDPLISCVIDSQPIQVFNLTVDRVDFLQAYTELKKQVERQ